MPNMLLLARDEVNLSHEPFLNTHAHAHTHNEMKKMVGTPSETRAT